MIGVCRHTNTWFTFALRSRSEYEAPEMVQFTIVHRCNGKTEICRIDQGSELVNHKMGAVMCKYNCRHETSCVGDFPMNRSAERNIDYVGR